MTDDEYPALYRSADSLAGRRQRAFFGALFAQLILLAAATALSSLGSADTASAYLQAATLLLALSVAGYVYAKTPDRDWYSARAVAESIKTTTWRFVACAEPFNHVTEVDRPLFVGRLKEIVEQNRGIAQQLDEHLDGDQVTRRMLELRGESVAERLSYYVKERVQNQREWYARRARENNARAELFFWLQVLANGLAVACAVGRIAIPEASSWPVDMLVVIASGILAWTQARRFGQLGASYALAAHEIGFVRDQADSVGTDAGLSRFVGDAENAFSREHTQWVARRDN